MRIQLLILITLAVLPVACIPTEAHTISGRISGSWQCINAGSSPVPATLTLLPIQMQTFFTRSQVEFSFTDVPDGDYALVASCTGLNGYPQIPITVAGEDVFVNIVLPFPTLPQLSPYARLVGHTDRIRSITFSKDGNEIFTASDDGMMFRWDLHTGEKAQALLHSHTDPDSPLVLSPGGEMLASGSQHGLIELWYTAQEKSLSTEPPNLRKIDGLALSSNGQWLVSWQGGEKNQIALWDVITGEYLPAKVFRPDSLLPVRELKLISFVDSSETFVSVEENDQAWSLTWWDTSTGQAIKARPMTRSEVGWLAQINSMDISKGETHIALGASGLENYGRIVIWDVPNDLWAIAEYATGLKRVLFSPDGTLLASTAYDNTVALWDVASATATNILVGDARGMDQLAWSPDGKMLAASNEDGAVLLWEIP